MRAVTGFVSSRKLVSVSTAATELSVFAASDTGARRDFASYLQRASAALDEIVGLHRQAGGTRKSECREIDDRKKRKKKRAGRDAEWNPKRVSEEVAGSMKEEEGERERPEDGEAGSLSEVELDYTGEITRDEGRKRKKEKKRMRLVKERS